MSQKDKPTLHRRDIMRGLTVPAILPVMSHMAMAEATTNVLVAYLTRSGNTRVFAEALSRHLRADLFEIRVRDPYPADYQAHVDRARAERDAGSMPALTADVPDLSRYETVILGFPIWGEALPAPVRSFLATHDIGERTLVPMVTHGGYGVGSALATLSQLAPRADQVDPFILECDQERRQLEQMNAWLSSISDQLR